MNHFEYRAGVLHAEEVPLPAIAAEVGTPFYCYATATLARHIRVFREAFADLDTLICYAMKANSNQSVIRTFVKEGAGLDVVSEGELRRALNAGARPDTIVFSGVAKSAPRIPPIEAPTTTPVMTIRGGSSSASPSTRGTIRLFSTCCTRV